MFSGIIQSIGTITQVTQKTDQSYRFIITNASIANKVDLGSSVCTSGVCLTVAEKLGDALTFDVMPETVRKTTLGNLKVGDRINLEPSLRLGDEISGHFVFGHVDCTAQVVAIEQDGPNTLMTIELSDEWTSYLAPQGTIAIDGVSLTVARRDKNRFTVSLVEYTWSHTTLSDRAVGDSVNIEIDMLAKYVRSAIVGMKNA